MNQSHLEFMHLSALFSGISDEFLNQLKQQANLLNYASGDFIFREKDTADSLFLIQKGKVELTLQNKTNHVVIMTLFPGNVFGELCLLQTSKRLYNARTADNCEVLQFEQAVFSAYLENNHPEMVKLYMNLSRLLSNRLEDANNLLYSISQYASLTYLKVTHHLNDQ